MDDSWIRFVPDFRSARSRRLIESCVRALSRIQPGGDGALSAINVVRERMLCLASGSGRSAQRARVVISVLCDIRAQGWALRLGRTHCWARKPDQVSTSPTSEKARVRAGHLIERDNQLANGATRRFVADIERRRPGPAGWVSIFSLMRDGQQLAAALRDIQNLSIDDRPAALNQLIDPYLQVVEPGAVCAFTGLKLTDIWRYFRHSWTSPYKSTPGRKVWLLVRDRAAENHPIVGIAALGSAVVQTAPRDRWIGWSALEFLAQMKARPTEEDGTWVVRSLSELIHSIYVRDLISDRVLQRSELRSPKGSTIRRLAKEAENSRKSHRLFPMPGLHKAANLGTARVDWIRLARTDLFRSKRSRALADLLGARMHLCRLGLKRGTKRGLMRVLEDRNGRRAIEVILRYVKATHVGVDMLDIIVCGAVPPYNALLGGKLVSLLTSSPEVVQAYASRYSRTPSVIASAMAGKPVRRRPQLVLLSTTSLYGVGSSQYNRLRVPASEVGARSGHQMHFEELGKTTGFGSFHLSSATANEMKVLVAQDKNGRRVNSIFGEGVNPRLRMMREALDIVGLPSDALLRHGSPRLVYGVPLATNFRDVLLGRSHRVRYILPQRSPRAVTAGLVGFWLRRWLSKRIDRPDVLRDVEQHSLIFPIRHGARIVLPPSPAGDQLDMLPSRD